MNSPGEMRGWRLLRKNNNSVLGYYWKVKTGCRIITENNNLRLVYIQNQSIVTKLFRFQTIDRVYLPCTDYTLRRVIHSTYSRHKVYHQSVKLIVILCGIALFLSDFLVAASSCRCDSSNFEWYKFLHHCQSWCITCFYDIQQNLSDLACIGASLTWIYECMQ